jgi:hypothetical protein
MPTKKTTTKPKAAEVEEETEVEQTTGSKDVKIIAPEPDVVELTSGSSVRVKPIKTRETFALLKILTRGAGPILTEFEFDRENPSVFQQQIATVLVMAIPEAMDEAIEFVQIMVEPVDPTWVDRPRTKEQRKNNEDLLVELYEELENPEIDDLVAIIITIITNEAEHLLALGKRLTDLFEKLGSKISAK